MKKLLNVIMTDKLILRVLSPEKGIDGPGFFSIFLFQSVLASAAGLITGKTAVVFVLTLFLFNRLVRARMNTTGSFRHLSIPATVVLSAGVTFSVMIERYLIYFSDFALLTQKMNFESGFMHYSVIAVRLVIASAILLALLTVILLSIFPVKKKSWAKWMKRYSVPVFSLSGSVSRTGYIYLMFIIQTVAIVIAVITAAAVIFLSFRAGIMRSPDFSVIAVLIVSSLLICLLLFASICAVMRRIRDLGSTWVLLALVIILAVITSASYILSNPAFSNVIFHYAGEYFGMSLMYWINFFVSPILGDILSGCRAVWVFVILYLTFYPGRTTERL